MLDVWLRQGQVAKTGLGGYEIYKPTGGCLAPHVSDLDDIFGCWAAYQAGFQVFTSADAFSVHCQGL